MTTSKPKLLFVGMDVNAAQALLGNLWEQISFASFATMGDFEVLLEQDIDTAVTLILAGDCIEGISAEELAQGLRAVYPSHTILYVPQNRDNYRKEVFIKNGFSDSYLLPLEKDLLQNTIEDLVKEALTGKRYRPVRLMDMSAGSKLNFEVSVFLPMNRRYVSYFRSGESVVSERLDKLRKNNHNAVYIDHKDMNKFQEYAAERLIELGNVDNSTVTATERQEKLEGAVRSIFSNVFNNTTKGATFESAKEIMDDTKDLVDAFIKAKGKADWNKGFQSALAGTRDSYSHAINVSTFAALFAIALELKHVEELAVAGLYHDLGLADIPVELAQKPMAEMTENERKMFCRHPLNSVEILKKRKMVLPDLVHKLIMQHHERFDGSGYPEGITGSRTSIEAQVLGIADEFDELTRFSAGERRRSPLQALDEMILSTHFDPEVLRRLKKVIKEQEEAEKSAIEECA